MDKTPAKPHAHKPHNDSKNQGLRSTPPHHENADKGNITYLDGVASIRNFCRGAFASSTGPWVRGVNSLVVAAVELDPFKSVLAGIVPSNNTDGANPVINTVLDETTLE